MERRAVRAGDQPRPQLEPFGVNRARAAHAGAVLAVAHAPAGDPDLLEDPRHGAPVRGSDRVVRGPRE
ncbi:hypothetical protein LP418_20865 [Nocardioides sp. B-3]|nr:hypothetical protein [Nocardioides sp. B-3]UUZ58584.1 hypothetical protein LP418_20865 [Nocardioides sp. B-3]